ncbi:MAG: rhodanese-like domain-containing protein [Clostridiales bacterium]|nr:rhodanese-like domain-containing protein [Clostridiales bacterium]
MILKNKRIGLLCLILCIIFLAISYKTHVENKRLNKKNSISYKQISQKKAKEMMDTDQDLTIVDVRRLDEYEEGHISGAVLFTNEFITEETAAEMFPDKDQILLIYCRSGNRSKDASEKLSSYGYSNVYEFGGIITWPYEIE